jgi:hypothetical protein
MIVTIRVDDIGWKPHATGRDKDLSLAQKFHVAMQGVPYLGAVIPICLDDRGREWLQSRPKGLTVAMHGITHEMVEPGVESEFAGRELRECSAMIALGKRILGVETEHFVAPWNHYGESLHEALSISGIIRHWVGPVADDKPESVRHLLEYSMAYAWKPLYGAILWPAGTDGIALAETMPEIMEREGRAVLTLHLTWEAAKGDDFKGVRWFVEKYMDQVISPEEYIL